MDVTGARKFRVSSRSLMLIIPMFTLLVASGIWNLRQHRLIEQQRLRVAAAEQEETARVAAEAVRVEARTKKNAEWAASDRRVKQLYREIDDLSRMSEQVLRSPCVKRLSSNGDSDGKATADRRSSVRPPL